MSAEGAVEAMSLKQQLPALIVITPLLGAVLCAFLKRSTIAWFVSLMVSWSLPVMAIMILQQLLEKSSAVPGEAATLSGKVISYHMGGWAPPQGIEYRVDMLSAFILILISVVGAITILYARKSVGKEIDSSRQTWFYTMYLLCIAGLLGITITGDAFNAFVFLEVSSLATYVLIALGKDRRSLVAAYQYLIMGTIGATFYVIGIGLLYSVTGSLNFADIASRLNDTQAFTRPVLAALAFIIVGISLKLALFPLHVWLPNAYAYSPSFASVFLAATATKVSIYLLLRFLFSIFHEDFVFEKHSVSEIFLILSIAAMFAASAVAIFEKNVKRMLAFSSVAQIGYITLGISLANQAGLTGGIVHLFNHALMKAALFMSIGAVFYRIGSVKIEDMAGIGRVMPVTMTAFVIGGLSLIGVPGTAGFIGKFYLAVGAIEKDMVWLVFVLVASSLLSVVYIGRIVEVAWFREPVDINKKAHEPPMSMMMPMVLLALVTIYLGIETSSTAGIASQAAQLLLGGGK
ncbi:MAG: monovalent cation/H+ antiporter subunit D family protein [Methyloligellaceae bacterium]